MCEPATIALAIGTGVSIAGVGASTGLGIYAGDKERAAEDERLARNIKLLRRQSADVRQRGAQEAADARKEGRQVASSARAALSKGEASASSMDNLVTRSNIGAERDANRAEVNAMKAAWGYQEEAKETQRMRKKVAEMGALSKLGAGLSGFGQIAGQVSGAIGKAA